MARSAEPKCCNYGQLAGYEASLRHWHFCDLETGCAQLSIAVEEHPESVPAEPGYVWLDMPGKVLYARTSDLEFQA